MDKGSFSAADTASFIGTLANELADLARKSDQIFLAFLLDVAALEAQLNERRIDILGQGSCQFAYIRSDVLD